MSKNEEQKSLRDIRKCPIGHAPGGNRHILAVRGRYCKSKDISDDISNFLTFRFNTAIENGKSLIVTDPKGVLYQEFSDKFQSHGYAVKYLNFDESSVSTGTYNPYEYVDDAKDANLFRKIFIKNRHWSFWVSAEDAMLNILILFVCRCIPAHEKTPEKISALLNEMLGNKDTFRKRVDELKLQYADIKATYDSICQWGDKSLAAYEDITEGVKALIKPLTTIRCERDTIDLHSFTVQKTVLFVTPGFSDEKDALESLLYAQIYRTIVKHAAAAPRIHTEFIVNNSHALFEVPDFIRLAMFYGKEYNFSFTFLFKSVDELIAVPTDVYRIIIACYTKIAYDSYDELFDECLGISLDQCPPLYCIDEGSGAVFTDDFDSYLIELPSGAPDMEYGKELGPSYRFVGDDIVKITPIKRLWYALRDRLFPPEM